MRRCIGTARLDGPETMDPAQTVVIENILARSFQPFCIDKRPAASHLPKSSMVRGPVFPYELKRKASSRKVQIYDVTGVFSAMAVDVSAGNALIPNGELRERSV